MSANFMDTLYYIQQLRQREGQQMAQQAAFNERQQSLREGGQAAKDIAPIIETLGDVQQNRDKLEAQNQQIAATRGETGDTRSYDDPRLMALADLGARQALKAREDVERRGMLQQALKKIEEAGALEKQQTADTAHMARVEREQQGAFARTKYATDNRQVGGGGMPAELYPWNTALKGAIADVAATGAAARAWDKKSPRDAMLDRDFNAKRQASLDAHEAARFKLQAIMQQIPGVDQAKIAELVRQMQAEEDAKAPSVGNDPFADVKWE